MDHARLRLPLALVAAVAVAQGGVLALRPRAGVIEPAPVSAGSYFSAEQIERARDYRRPGRAIYGAQLVLQGGLLVVLALRAPRLLRHSWRRPALGGAAVAASLSLALGVASLPLSALSRQRAIDVGLATQSWPGWGLDVAKSGAIGAGMAGVGGAVGLVLMRRWPRHWWAPASALAVVVSAGFLFAGPVVLDPLFNRFQPLAAGPARADVMELARRAGVKVGEVYEIDASRRTTAANAYVTGLGATKRVVLYDNLLTEFTREEQRQVVAHELAHVRHRDLGRGLLYVAVVAPFALLAVQRLAERLPGHSGTPAALPAVALALAAVSTVAGTISNQLSRRVEARADSFALSLTEAPRSFIDFEQRITVRNVSDPDPPAWVTALLGTHPPAVERIGAAVAFERERAGG
jgi:STE24 endopeptidase